MPCDQICHKVDIEPVGLISQQAEECLEEVGHVIELGVDWAVNPKVGAAKDLSDCI